MKQRLILGSGGILLLIFLFFFGKTVEKKTAVNVTAQEAQTIPVFSINTYIQSTKEKLSTGRQNYLLALENNISRGDVKEQQLKDYNALASFWKDSVNDHTGYDFYIAQSAKLVNSEKSLTFAAQLTLEDLRLESDPAKKSWKEQQAIDLFKRAIAINPDNDNLKVGLGSCYVFGDGMAGNAQETMKGIQQLLEVVHKDSTNMQAQLVLGIGGVVSEQYEKAISRLLIVIKNEPDNIEAISWLADAYAGEGDKANAIKWYEISKRMISNPQYSKEVDERIKMLH